MVELRVCDEDHREMTCGWEAWYSGAGGARWEAFYVDGTHGTQKNLSLWKEKRIKCGKWRTECDE